MLLVKRKGSCDGVTWRCPRKGCRKELLYEGEHFLKVTVEIMVVDRNKKKTLILGSLDFKTTTAYDIQYQCMW